MHELLKASSSPGVNLPAEVVVALVDFLNLSLLSFNVRTMLLEVLGHGITAAFGQAQVLLCLGDHWSLRLQV